MGGGGRRCVVSLNTHSAAQARARAPTHTRAPRTSRASGMLQKWTLSGEPGGRQCRRLRYITSVRNGVKGDITFFGGGVWVCARAWCGALDCTSRVGCGAEAQLRTQLALAYVCGRLHCLHPSTT